MRLDPLEELSLEERPPTLGPETERGEGSGNPFGDQSQDRTSSFLRSPKESGPDGRGETGKPRRRDILQIQNHQRKSGPEEELRAAERLRHRRGAGPQERPHLHSGPSERPRVQRVREVDPAGELAPERGGGGHSTGQRGAAGGGLSRDLDQASFSAPPRREEGVQSERGCDRLR
jgi:hypothetical protein